MEKQPTEPVLNPHPAVSEKDVSTMSRRKLTEYALKIGARPGESLEDSAIRFEQEGDNRKAELLHYMAFRWWALKE